MRVLVTGSRHWEDAGHIWQVLDEARARLGPFDLVVGDCPTGVDAHAWSWAILRGINHVEVHHADWSGAGRAAGPLRNQAMVDSGVDHCFGFPLGASKGTRDCMTRAKAAGIPTYDLSRRTT